ncbi:iron-siderophore ABC transporter substrate-binding protein [Neorhizobium lilium]|uniref:Iron-siderophore ABC transporter substrate-binding protein n=2 Tax=Neorhizobium lilium TaxID=2503024 RepID=A0A3S3RYU4_9HYPH|nr:iron-siderophore ABC transporter substrate-binding protein [Neorhizobium lilium]
MSRRQMMSGFFAGCLLPNPFSTVSDAQAAEGDLRFEHVYGETVLRQPASRVVSLGYTTQDALLALGVAPLAVRQWFGNQTYGVWPWGQPLLGDAKPQMISGEVSMEIVAGLQPDLIVGVGSGISREEYEVLSQIAPVLMQPPGETAFGMRWDSLTRMIGRAVGKAELAEQRVAEVKSVFATARARHPDWSGRTAICAYNFGGETGAYIGTDTRATFLTELGLQPTEKVKELGVTQGFYARLSPEDLSPLDADVLIWLSSSDAVPDVVALPLRKTLRAHREGREVAAGELMTAALTFGSVLSLPFTLQRLEKEIALAMDGDPTTPVPSSIAAGLAP